MVSRVNACLTGHAPLSNLRAVVILIVVAFHSMLPYLASQSLTPLAFDAPPYRWIAFPIIDRERWFGFDLFCAWQDISLMSLMFFLAGTFTPQSLLRKGSLPYLRERWWRIGLPFLLAAALLSPLAYFASYRATAADPSIGAFWKHWLALPMWPAGPAWFLWQLFVLSALAAGLHAFAPQWLSALGHLADDYADRPLAIFLALTTLSMVAYVPLAIVFSAWDWTFLGPFSVQLSRPLHYLLYFFAGFAAGGNGLHRGLLRSDAPLGRHWLVLLAAAVASFALWGELTSLTMPDWNASSFASKLLAACAFPVACAAGVLSLLAVALRFMRWRDSLCDSLSARAYGIYLVHYVFVLWLQYALLPATLGAIAKVTIVFAGALAASWLASAGLSTLLALLPGLRSRNVEAAPMKR